VFIRARLRARLAQLASVRNAALAFELGQRIVQAKTDVGDAAGVFHVSNEQGKKTLLLQLFI